MEELTIEITSYCDNYCRCCSSDAKNNEWELLPYNEISNILTLTYVNKYWDVIHISGGEPLSHPDFYNILKLCEQKAREVVVHTNAIKRIAFNPNVIDGVYVDVYLNPFKIGKDGNRIVKNYMTSEISKAIGDYLDGNISIVELDKIEGR